MSHTAGFLSQKFLIGAKLRAFFLSVSGNGERPMADCIFQSKEYTELYHQYFAEFLETVDVQKIIEDAEAIIAPYVEKDPTKFYTFEEFEKGVATLKEFCELRTESIETQLLYGKDFTAVDASYINTSDMGSMGGNGGFGGFDKASCGKYRFFFQTLRTAGCGFR